MVFRVDRYGWTWLATDPPTAALRKKLVEEWERGAATELLIPVPGRRRIDA